MKNEIKWTPITQSLPPEDTWVLMWFECSKCRNGHSHNITDPDWANVIHHRAYVGKINRKWVKSGNSEDYFYNPQKPTHWAELPEPPELEATI